MSSKYGRHDQGVTLWKWLMFGVGLLLHLHSRPFSSALRCGGFLVQSLTFMVEDTSGELTALLQTPWLGLGALLRGKEGKGWRRGKGRGVQEEVWGWCSACGGH